MQSFKNILRLTDQFCVAAGTIAGRRHVGSANLLAGRNNQDAYACTAQADFLVFSVHDGCGSSAYSEFGAKLGAQITPWVIKEALKRLGPEKIQTRQFWDLVRERFLHRLFQVASICTGEMAAYSTILTQNAITCRDSSNESSTNEMDMTFEQFVRSHLLFTTLGAVITNSTTIVFGIGDGIFLVNDEIQEIGPFPDNAPDYLSSDLLSNTKRTFSIHAALNTKELNTLILGTDGMKDLIDSAGKCIPGKKRKVETLQKLLNNECLFCELKEGYPGFESLTGWLRLLNSEVVKIGTAEDGSSIISRDEGLLPDDTTLVALRRNMR